MILFQRAFSLAFSLAACPFLLFCFLYWIFLISAGLCTQTKDRALADLEVNNSRLKAELRSLQEDLAVQEEELAFQQRELEQLRERCCPPEPSSTSHPPPKLVSSTTSPIRHQHHQLHSFISSVDASSLCSPELLRRPDASMEERGAIHLHAISHLSELSGLQPGASRLDLLHGGGHGRGRGERGGVRGGGGSSQSSPSHSISMPPEPDTEPERQAASSSSLRSPTSLCASDNYSMLDSLDADKVRGLSVFSDLCVVQVYSCYCVCSWSLLVE